MQYTTAESGNDISCAGIGGGCHEADNGCGIVHAVDGGGLDA
jgi:hypothetical protein